VQRATGQRARAKTPRGAGRVLAWCASHEATAAARDCYSKLAAAIAWATSGRAGGALGGGQQHLGLAAVVDARHPGEAVGEHLPLAGAGHWAGRDDGRVVGYRDDRGVLAPEEGDDELEPRRVDEHYARAVGHAPAPAQRATHRPPTRSHLAVGAGLLLLAPLAQPRVKSLAAPLAHTGLKVRDQTVAHGCAGLEIGYLGYFYQGSL